MGGGGGGGREEALGISRILHPIFSFFTAERYTHVHVALNHRLAI